MKITYLVNQIQPNGSTRLSSVPAAEWRSVAQANKELPAERQRYFIRDYIADEDTMDCMVIEVSTDEYTQWDKERSAARRNRDAEKGFHMISLDAPMVGTDGNVTR